MLAACDSASPDAGDPLEPGSATTEDEGDGLGAPEGSRLERSLRTTDLRVSVREGAEMHRLTVRNDGPNPADDVWITVVPAGATSVASITCGRRGDVDECRLGPLPAREERHVDVAAAEDIEVTVSVEDRAGVDADAADNTVRFGAR